MFGNGQFGSLRVPPAAMKFRTSGVIKHFERTHLHIAGLGLNRKAMASSLAAFDLQELVELEHSWFAAKITLCIALRSQRE